LEDVRIEKGPFHRRLGWGRGRRAESYIDAEAGAAGTRQKSGKTGAAEATAKWTLDASRIAPSQYTSSDAYLSEPKPVGAEFPANARWTKQGEFDIWQWIIVNLDYAEPNDPNR
jgi:hypothetical protein